MRLLLPSLSNSVDCATISLCHTFADQTNLRAGEIIIELERQGRLNVGGAGQQTIIADALNQYIARERIARQRGRRIGELRHIIIGGIVIALCARNGRQMALIGDTKRVTLA